jgi:hypothetical protein
MDPSFANMPLPPCRLYTNLTRLPTQQCGGNHPSSPRSVRAEFAPAYCHHHGNNADPTVGWAYLTRDEATMLTILRQRLWFDEALSELRARDLEVGIQSVEIADTPSDDSSSEEVGSPRA